MLGQTATAERLSPRSGQISEQAGERHEGRKRRTPDEVHVKKAANGGFIVRHTFDNIGAGESYMPPKEHAFGSHREMMDHVFKHTGGKGERSIGKDEGAEEGTGEPKADGDEPKATGAKTQTRGGQVSKADGQGKGGRAPNQRTYGAGVD